MEHAKEIFCTQYQHTKPSIRKPLNNMKPLKILSTLFLIVQMFPGAPATASEDPATYVNPFIGTGGHGHTFPGPTLPFGMVQLSPDTRLSGWDGCSGYHFTDSIIYGFSHTHLSGTGCSDYGDVLLTPTVGQPKWKSHQYASRFRKETEKATAGYYSVYLDDPKVLVELTSTLRTGLHKYTFPESNTSNIQLDLSHRDKGHDTYIEINGDQEIAGYRISNQWASDQQVFFVIQFSKPFREAGIGKGKTVKADRGKWRGKNLKAFAQFSTSEGEAIYVKVGISPVSIEGARKNLEAEQSGFDFERVYREALNAWNQELGKIKVTGSNTDHKTIFYTALYHSMIAPNIYQDVDGRYLGRDRKIHRANDMGYYTVFSLWDTYRALHPLLTIIDRARTADFVKTFLLQYEQGGLLPVWELSAYETFCMIGYHAVPVIADAWQKGITDFDGPKALEAMRHSAELSEREMRKYKLPGNLFGKSLFYAYKKNFNQYQKHGYQRHSLFSSSVSKTLEYAYDDWCIAQMALSLGDSAAYQTYIQRAANYKHVFDPETGFMRARNRRGFVRKFDPYKVSNSIYTEANAWQYSFYVPQDISGHMALLGGKEQYARKLDDLFSISTALNAGRIKDVSGLIGQYAHGNEPSHHIAYLYNYAGQPWKAQQMVHRIMNEMYQNQPDGLSGNEDCGQMSAWYVFSAMGFYPVTPGSDHYAIGSPLFDEVTIELENGKTFSIWSANAGGENVYIQSARLNGQRYTKSYIRYEDISAGGLLEFEMGSSPNINWGSAEGDVPVIGIPQ